MLKGYVRNMTHLWAHTMKRSVGPGAQIPLSELYDQYGKKYNLAPNDEFVKWLQEVKLRDKERWQIFGEQGTPYVFGSLEKEEKKEVGLPAEVVGENVVEKSTTQSRGENVVPIVPKAITVDDIVGLTFRKAKEVLPKILDVQLLKYAAQQANQMADKDSLCRLLRKRIQELEVSSRR